MMQIHLASDWFQNVLEDIPAVKKDSFETYHKLCAEVYKDASFFVKCKAFVLGELDFIIFDNREFCATDQETKDRLREARETYIACDLLLRTFKRDPSVQILLDCTVQNSIVYVISWARSNHLTSGV